MKKLTQIDITNFKAYKKRTSISLPKGENLLVYGENGSGKSSLTEAIRYLLRKSLNSAIPFQPNLFSGIASGDVAITISDIDENTHQVANVQTATASESSFVAASNDLEQMVRDLAHSRVFLQYSNIVKVYFQKMTDEELFRFIIEDVLYDYIPVSEGATQTIGEMWDSLNRDYKKGRNRNDRVHKTFVLRMNKFSIMIDKVLRESIKRLDEMLQMYFEDTKISVNHVFTPISMDYGNVHAKRDWRMRYGLKLQIFQSGTMMQNPTAELNEARLSACSICLYLATAKSISSRRDLKLLVLDDIFIGLDLGNRRPLLEILKKEFADHQLILLTYDKSWYELVKSAYFVKDAEDWKLLEMYESTELLPSGQEITKPLLITNNSEMSCAHRYLHEEGNLNYSAAANHFRKALEEMLDHYIPAFGKISDDFSEAPVFKLTSVLKRTELFLKKFYFVPEIADLYRTIQEIQQYLGSLLHPLSHGCANVPIYKKELYAVERILLKLEEQLKAASLGRIKPVLECGAEVEYQPICTTASYKYKLRLEDNLFKIDFGGKPLFADCKCYVTYMESTPNGGEKSTMKVTKNSKIYELLSYRSLQEATQKLIKYVKDKEGNILNDLGDEYYRDWKCAKYVNRSELSSYQCITHIKYTEHKA